ncbi:MAG: amidohydrolase [Vicinamibacteria bacterium]
MRLLLFCSIAYFTASPVAGQSSSEAADLVLRGGKVITVDARNRIASAVAVQGNRIAAVGTDEEIAARIGPRTEIVELRGRALLPGFIDAHTHVDGTAENEHFRVQIQVPPLQGPPEILEKLKMRAAEAPKGSWIVGQGTYAQPMPSREDLDRAIPDHAVVLRWSAHDFLINAKAAELAGITAETPNPEGGTIERGPKGEATILRETATRLVHIPPPSHEEMRGAIRATLGDLFLKQGVTTVYEMPHAVEPVQIYQELKDDGMLPVRLAISYFIGPGFAFELEDLLETGFRTGFGDDWLKVGAVKILLDGAGVSAATYDPHPGTTDHRGTLTREPEVLNRQVLLAHKAGWQIWIHAIGDRAQDLALDAFEAAQREFPRDDARHRIEHFGNAVVEKGAEERYERLARLEIIPVPEPSFLWAATGSRRPRPGVTSFAIKSLIERGFQPPGNSDTLGTMTRAINPWFPISRAILRTSHDGTEVDPHEAISVMDGIRMHTIWAAYSGFEEKAKGSIEVGKLADLVVLSGDPLTQPADRLLGLRVEMTIVDGKITYAR